MTQKQIQRRPAAAQTAEKTAGKTAKRTAEATELEVPELPSDATTCARCGTELATTDAFMDVDGTVCMECQGEAELGEAFRKAYLSVGGTAFGLAGASFLFNPFAIVSVLSIIAMVATFLYPRRLDEEDREAVAGYKAPMILAVLGGLISMAQLALAAVRLVSMLGG